MVWTVANIPNLSGKVIVVTGASSGIGLWSAEHFSRAGAKVILAVRNVSKGEGVAQEIRMRMEGAKDAGELVVMELDVSKTRSVKDFAKAYKERFSRLDVLLNNAGIMMVPWATSEDGWEMHYATNHLGHFLLTGLLLDTLKKTKGSRIVNVSSIAHASAQDVDYEIMQGKDKGRYKKIDTYAQTKLANLFFTFELSRRLKKAGADVLAVAAHPGWSRTSLQGNASIWWFGIVNAVVSPFLSQDSEAGSLPLLMASTDPEAKPGDYYGPGKMRGMKGPPQKVEARPYAKDEAKGKKLWEVSEKLVGLKYLSE